jgi:YfiH family protein
MNFHSLSIGKVAQDHHCVFFFGNRTSSMEELQTEFPDLTFIRLKQLHSDVIVQSSPPTSATLAEGDAHLCALPNLALCITTADCVPVLIHDRKRNQVAAIHAGWRGVAQRILPKTLLRMNCDRSGHQDIQIVIGPHIQFESFEVGNDVRDQILASIQAPKEKHFTELATGKSRVHLLNILLSQLEEFNIPAEDIHLLNENTVLSADYNSYRRDKNSAGRQISFVALRA